MSSMACKQRGIGFPGFLGLVVVVIFSAITVMKLIPAYMEHSEINHILNVIANDPEMRNAPLPKIRESFSKRAIINNITVVSANDIQIDKDEGVLTLTVSYPVKIPLAGNLSLLLEFSASSAK